MTNDAEAVSSYAGSRRSACLMLPSAQKRRSRFEGLLSMLTDGAAQQLTSNTLKDTCRSLYQIAGKVHDECNVKSTFFCHLVAQHNNIKGRQHRKNFSQTTGVDRHCFHNQSAMGVTLTSSFYIVIYCFHYINSRKDLQFCNK